MNAKGAGIVGILVVALALSYSVFKGFGLGGGSGPAGSGDGSSRAAVTVSVEGGNYVVNGKPARLDEVIALADYQSKTGQPIIVIKKASARVLTIKRLQDELDERRIRYRSEDGF